MDSAAPIVFSHTRLADAPFVAGRRAFLKFRDIGASAATNERLRGNIISSEAAMSQPTGWHYHSCDIQFLFMISGWADLEFNGGAEVHRLHANTGCILPGGTPHNECRTADAFQTLELSLPGPMGTTPVEATTPPPPRTDNRRPHFFAVDTATIATGDDAFFTWRDFGLAAPSEGLTGAYMITPSGSESGAWITSAPDIRMIYVVDGAVTIETDSGPSRAGAGDTIILPAGTRYRASAATGDLRAIVVQTPA